MLVWSLPSWERGLKCWNGNYPCRSGKVAPLVGARIEIQWATPDPVAEWVAPLVGARIEMWMLPDSMWMICVAPLVGARIEILIPRV